MLHIQVHTFIRNSYIYVVYYRVASCKIKLSVKLLEKIYVTIISLAKTIAARLTHVHIIWALRRMESTKSNYSRQEDS